MLKLVEHSPSMRCRHILGQSLAQMQPRMSFLGGPDVTAGPWLGCLGHAQPYSALKLPELLLELELELALGRDQFIPHGNSIVLSGNRESSMLGSSLVVVVLPGYSIVTWQYSRYKCNLVEAQGCNDEAAIHRRLARICHSRWVSKGGFWVPRWDSLLYLSPLSPLCASGDVMQGARGLPQLLLPNLAVPPTLAWQPGSLAGHTRSSSPLCCHCSTELVNHLSLARAAVSTVRYLRTPQSAATLLPRYPAALPAPAGPGYMCMYSYESSSSLGEVEDTCKTVPLGEWREAKGVFMHRRPLQYIRPQTRPFANPQTTDCSIEGAIICFFVSIHFC